MYDANNNLIDFSDSLSNNSHYIYNHCLENSCYKLVVNDTEGDGFCCNYGNGNISVNKVLNNQEIAQLSYFSFSNTINFCISALNNTEIFINQNKDLSYPNKWNIIF